MTEKKLRFAIFGNEYQAKKSASIHKILSVLQAYGSDVYIDRPFCDFLLSERIAVEGVQTFEGDGFDADFIISMGGDGTFLKAAARVGSKRIPIMGINMGRLGYLSDTMPHEIEKAVACLYAGDYRLESHSVISATLSGEDSPGGNYALNDIAILKRDTAAMISIRVSIDNEFMATYQADGLIVSTPTGSTAYSLSNGGPIMVPNADTLCLTPVAPHSLNIRPVVINASSAITLAVESRSHNFLLAVDGRSTTLKQGVSIVIKKAPYSVDIVKLRGKHYYSTLREKMMWGVDTRN